MAFRVSGPSDGYRLLVSLSACPVPMLASHRPYPAGDTFTLHPAAVMLVTEAEATSDGAGGGAQTLGVSSYAQTTYRPGKEYEKMKIRRTGHNRKAPCDHIVRGYFGLGDHEHVVHITSSEDFLLYIWARNVETSQGGVQILTPPSQFRGSGSTGPQDGLVLDVPAQTGKDLGCVGAQGGETIDISNASGARVRVFLTVITANGATVAMTWA